MISRENIFLPEILLVVFAVAVIMAMIIVRVIRLRFAEGRKLLNG